MIYNISSAYSNSASKLYVPVNKASLLYSHFDHVSGIAAGKGQNGISISRIQILNALIDRLSTMKTEAKPAQIKNASPEQVESMIRDYQQQIKQTVETAQTQPYVLAGNKPEPGVLFSVDA